MGCLVGSLPLVLLGTLTVMARPLLLALVLLLLLDCLSCGLGLNLLLVQDLLDLQSEVRAAWWWMGAAGPVPACGRWRRRKLFWFAAALSLRYWWAERIAGSDGPSAADGLSWIQPNHLVRQGLLGLENVRLLLRHGC